MKRESQKKTEETIKKVKYSILSNNDAVSIVTEDYNTAETSEKKISNLNNEKNININYENRKNILPEESQNNMKKLISIDLRNFISDKILNWNSREKLLIIKGKFKNSKDDSVLILQKNPFPENLEDFENSLLKDKFEVENIMRNDIYGTYSICGLDSINNIKVTMVSPATEKHIRKYSKPQIHFLNETPFIYVTITYPFIVANQFSTNWVKNIIKGRAEEERVLYRSEGNTFLIAMDFKWDGLSKDSLHCLAILGDDDAPKSLRDLNFSHLSLLKEIFDAGISVISNKYDIPRSQLRLFVHYPPSFYHLHVHITHISNDSSTALIDRAHPLSSIIRNIEIKHDYYQEAVIDVTVQDNDPLFEIYRINKCFQ